MLYLIILLVTCIVFNNWFTFLPISSGDLGFFYKEQIIQYFNPPFMWETFRNLGFGGDSFLHQGVYIYNFPLGILGHYLDYGVIERIIWFYPIILAGFISPLILGRELKLFSSRLYALIPLFYLLNTYFFMIMGGGQLTVVFGYLAIPTAFAVFLSTIRAVKFYKIVIFSLIFSFLVLFDFRYTYIFLILVFLYAIFSCFFISSFSELFTLIRKYVIIFLFAFLLTLTTQAYWVIPYIAHYHSPTTGFGSAYTTTEAVSYFSFAKFENSFSLLHPYWPENIFGKVEFMKPEFLFLPLLAFASLLFINVKSKTQNLKNNATREQFNNRLIIFFALLALVGAFLSKGANPPFGAIYLWMFTHIPGFIMFRDPTKWYTFVAISYSVLIPFSVGTIYSWLESQPKFQISNFKFQIKSKNQIFNSQNLFLIFVICYLLFLIRPAIFGQLVGTLKPVMIPKDYIDFKNFLLKESTFSRVLWVPTMQRFTFYSNIHPAISGKDFFNTYNEYGVIDDLQKNRMQAFLQQSGVKYLVVPDDTQKEIFIKDRKYDEKQYAKTIQVLEKIPWIHEAYTFERIRVFEVTDSVKDHFWSTSPYITINQTFINPTKYKLEIKNAKIGDRIIFSETYDTNWFANDAKNSIYETPYNKYFNSFILQKAGDYVINISYKPQENVKLGIVISTISLLVIISYILYMMPKFLHFKN